MSLFQKNDVVLFQGDSVTDCGRNRDEAFSMGTGYAMMASALYSAQYPDHNITFINKGIGGDRVVDLQSRWKVDALDLQPNWVSILIGINDCWRKYDQDDETSTEEYYNGYKQLLQQTKNELNAGIILCEPFLLPVPEDRKQWRVDLDPKIQAVRELAREFNTIYVPLDGIFAQASTQATPAYWLPDGVHPTSAGHALISQSWLKAVKA